MHIIGIGLDATDIDRLERVLERYGDRFVTRVFTPAEITYCRGRYRQAPHFAGRFAAKEAAMKALGTGHSHGVLWTDIEVIRGGGPPRIEFHGGALRRFHELGATGSLVSITHGEALALAQVMLVREK
jgi:holo-[acyl-carrier protein] synthase